MAVASAEITAGAESYALVVHLADRSTGETRVCTADVAISAGQSSALAVEAGSIAEGSPGEPPRECSLEVTR
jgi:hypothetical protein